MDAGVPYRTYLWRRARQKAMPKTMPLLVVRMHVARAHALGLDYPTYAALRKSTGRDIMGLLFSSNALRVVKADEPHIPVDRAEVVSAVEGARKLALVHKPLRPAEVQLANPILDAVGQAPLFTDNWSDMREHLGKFVVEQRLTRDQVLVIGDTSFERDWGAAAQAAGYLEADRYFR
jgi:hypothetical protein